MKKEYSKPRIEIEAYELDASIAANCGAIISFGPPAPGKTTCDEFKGAFGGDDDWGTFSVKNSHTPFYADGAANCDCYYTSGNSGYFTS